MFDIESFQNLSVKISIMLKKIIFLIEFQTTLIVK